MKRQLLGTLLAVLCLGITACGRPEQEKAPAPLVEGAGTVQTDPAEEPETLGAPVSLGEPFPWPQDVPEPTALPASQTVEGWTLSLTRAEGDKYGAYLTLELTAPEGVALDADNYFLNCSPMLETPSGYGMGINMVDDGDKTDNKISFLLNLSCNGDIRGVRGVLEADGLEAIHRSQGHENDTVTPLNHARWQLPFQIESLENTVVSQPGRQVETSQGALTVDRVEVGPFSVSMEVSGPDITKIRLEQESDLPPRPGEVTFWLEDEKGEHLKITGSTTLPKGKEAMTLVCTFSHQIAPIDPAAAAALVIEGTRIPLG